MPRRGAKNSAVELGPRVRAALDAHRDMICAAFMKAEDIRDADFNIACQTAEAYMRKEGIWQGIWEDEARQTQSDRARAVWRKRHWEKQKALGRERRDVTKRTY